MTHHKKEGISDRFVEEMRFRMRQRRLSWKDLAREMGVSDVTVFYWMTGRIMPRYRTVARLERLLRVPRGTLLIALAYGDDEE